MRSLVKGKRWLLLARWVHLNSDKRQQLNHLFSLNRKIMKAYLLKESLERLWTYTYEGAMMRYLQSWIGQLRPNAWFGAATGRTRTKPRNRMTQCCSI
jgi:hypothetical protein